MGINLSDARITSFQIDPLEYVSMSVTTEAGVTPAIENEDVAFGPSERKSVVWRCSKGFGAGRYDHEPCGKLNAIWTIFDPNVGGHRKKRWLGHCKHCPKVTAINPAAGNIVAVFPTRQEGIDYAKATNVALEQREAAQAALQDEIGGEEE